MNDKTYTPEQMTNAENMMNMIGTLSEDRQAVVTMVTNAFIYGMEAEARMLAGSKAKPGA